MFLQSYLYYQLRAIHEMVVHPEDCLDFTPSKDLLQMAIDSTLDMAECVYLNFLALVNNVPSDELSTVLHRVIGILWATKFRLEAGSQLEIFSPLTCFLEDEAFSVMEEAGYPEPIEAGAQCLRVEGCGYAQLLIPSVCGPSPSKAMGFYTERELEAGSEYLKRAGALCSMVPACELEEDHSIGCHDWVISHVCAFTPEETHRVRGQIFAQLWHRDLVAKSA